MFDDYGTALKEALEDAPTLREQIAAWLELARVHRGVVRAAQELTRAGTSQAEVARSLRDECARLIATRLQPAKNPRDKGLRGASLMVADIVRQYVLMESAGWIPERDTDAIAAQLERLLEHGLYR